MDRVKGDRRCRQQRIDLRANPCRVHLLKARDGATRQWAECAERTGGGPPDDRRRAGGERHGRGLTFKTFNADKRGTADDPGTSITYFDYPAELAGRANEYFIISNDPTAGEKHKALDLQVAKRISRGWQFLAGYSITKNDAKLPESGNFTRNIPQWNPNVDINAGNHTWEQLAKLSGNITLPYDVSMSANYLYQSGQPQARQVLFTGGKQIPSIVLNAEPVGSIHLPDTSVLDLRFQKTFTFKGVRATPRVNTYNLPEQQRRERRGDLLRRQTLPAPMAGHSSA